ncbi:MAG: YfhO family protein [Verrucomicrobiota bacterium]
MFFALPRVSAANQELDDWFTPGRFTVFLLAAIFAAYPEVMLGSHTFFYRDYGHFAYPLAHYHREAFWNGEIPLWNPLSNCGLPFVAQWNTMVFYPLSLIYLLLPMPWAPGYFSLAHLLLAGVAMYFLALRWTGNRFAAAVAGTAYALNGLTLHSVMWTNNIAALAWMPLVVLFIERAWREGGRRLVIAALLGTVQMLAGAPEIILFTWLVCAAVLAGQLFVDLAGKLPKRPTLNEAKLVGEWVLRFVVVAVLVAGLAAIQLMPFLDLLQHSQRSEGFGDSGWSMPPWGWANFLVPLFHASPSVTGVFTQNEQQWTSSYYAGIGIVALSLLAVFQARRQRVWLLAMVAGFGLLMALGDEGGVYAWFRALFPQVGFARFPIKFVALAIFALPLLAAFAVPRFTEGGVATWREAGAAALWAGLALVILSAVILISAARDPFPDDKVAETIRNGVVRLVLLGLLLGAFATMHRMDSPRGFCFRIAALVLLAVDALTHTPRQNPTVITQAYEQGLAKWPFRPKDGESRAMISPRMHAFMDRAANTNYLNYCIGCRQQVFANWNLLDGMPKVNGFYSLYTQEQWDVWSLLYQTPSGPPSRLLDFTGVSQITDDSIMFQWNRRPTALPVITGGQMPVFTNAAATLNALRSPAFDPRRFVYLPEGATNEVSIAKPTLVRVLTNTWGAHEVTAEVEALDPALLVVAQTYYHPWRAYVNDEPVTLLRANHAFQAVPIPAGKSRVRLVYEDEKFAKGAMVSLITLAICVVLWFLKQRIDVTTPQE